MENPSLHIVRQYFMPGKAEKLSDSDISFILMEAKNKLSKDPTVYHLKSPLIVVGDLHGNLKDLLHIFQTAGTPPEHKFLFLGDYIDRGPQSVELLLLLFSLKVLYPDNIFLLRGNHETINFAEPTDFTKECKAKLFSSALILISEVFDEMPIAALVDEKIWCIHGGLSQGYTKISQIQSIKRPLKTPENGYLVDLLWSDPNCQVQEWGPNQRGNTVVWGAKAAKKFMEENSISYIIRAHQAVFDGFKYAFPPDKSVVTLYSSSFSTNGTPNKAAYCSLSPGNPPKFTQLFKLANNTSFNIYWKDGHQRI
ncbi:Ser/Thr protein phosphatase, putative [Trichomonas vaginalis G3]|uniref:Serine/threonine-protein phosphatase n=1 Tax=Trichomonas vaginalis (strain ATCC PRA-98 / G3) TaxID=412133 RepID=A2FI08_TRIV3|nr:phosphoprotein phosphatase protein [Trichomonas vaginalis G3]EAX95436.1 Ser/Thr protein phosphatase, putative [Trichomonas vaginalis G3]KAI5542887.1 phosphoprotein phosphatase protein [Trichomonas vaginalis G3]|eukprot:XP_001308366.1 Ser/Thr protein phosphatase [Trichomonas vaginalis G3]